MLNREQSLSILARLAMLRGWCVAGREQESIEMFELIKLELGNIENDIRRQFGYRYDTVRQETISKLDDEISSGISPRDILSGLGDPFA